MIIDQYVKYMKISIIIPTYKPGFYLYNCLDSIKNQTLKKEEFEIVIVLNGCFEPYYSDIRTYIDNNLHKNNVKLLHVDLGGVSNARNIGIKNALGEYIAFIDDDDIISPNYLEELLKMSTHNIVGVSNVHTFKKSVKNYTNNFFACKVIQQQRHPKSLFKNRSILSFPVAKLIHRNIIGGHLFDLRFANGEDALFMTQISDKIASFAFTKQSACYYVREREGSATRRKLNKRKLIKDTYLLIETYIKTYFSAPLSYNFLLFLSRIPGVIKGSFKLYHNI